LSDGVRDKACAKRMNPCVGVAGSAGPRGHPPMPPVGLSGLGRTPATRSPALRQGDRGLHFHSVRPQRSSYRNEAKRYSRPGELR
jgi:hypothetical protein